MSCALPPLKLSLSLSLFLPVSRVPQTECECRAQHLDATPSSSLPSLSCPVPPRASASLCARRVLAPRGPFSRVPTSDSFHQSICLTRRHIAFSLCPYYLLTDPSVLIYSFQLPLVSSPFSTLDDHRVLSSFLLSSPSHFSDGSHLRHRASLLLITIFTVFFIACFQSSSIISILRTLSSQALRVSRRPLEAPEALHQKPDSGI